MPRPVRDAESVPEWARILKSRRVRLGLTQEQVASESGDLLTQGIITDLERGKAYLDRTSTPRLLALARGLRWTPLQLQEETGVDLGFRPEEFRQPPNLTPAMRERGDKVVEDFLSGPGQDLIEVDYYRTGAGPAIEEDQPAGRIFVPAQYGDHRKAMFVRVDGDCMVPLYPVGWYAVVIPDMALWHPGADALVWLANNGRKLCKVVEVREDGDHWLWQSNPPPGEDHHLLAPVGSRVLGVVIDCVRGGPSRLTSRELADLLRHRPGND
jgi:transcriptional regulator with XRE-family HTH domain